MLSRLFVPLYQDLFILLPIARARLICERFSTAGPFVVAQLCEVGLAITAETAWSLMSCPVT